MDAYIDMANRYPRIPREHIGRHVTHADTGMRGTVEHVDANPYPEGVIYRVHWADDDVTWILASKVDLT